MKTLDPLRVLISDNAIPSRGGIVLVEKEIEEDKPLFRNLTGNSKLFGLIVQGGFGLTLIGLVLRYFLLVYKFDRIKGAGGDFFEGVADFFGLVAFFGMGAMIFGLISVALMGKEVHLYLRIGILITLAIIISRFFSLGFFF